MKTPGRLIGVVLMVTAVLFVRPTSAAWGPPGDVAAVFVDMGPPANCLPPTTRLDLNKQHDVFIQLYFNQLAFTAVTAGGNPLFAAFAGWAVAGWDAVSHYDCNATPFNDLGIPRRPASQRATLNRNRALAAALLRMQELSDPVVAAISRDILAKATPRKRFLLAPKCDGGDKAYNIPECVGIRAAEVAFGMMVKGGWNYDGSLARQYNKRPFADYTGYVPKNSPWELTRPCNWQPLHETDGRGKFWVQSHVLPYAPNVSTILLDKATAKARTVKMWNCTNPAAYKAAVDEVLAASAGLNDTTKQVAEYLAKPFHLITTLQLASAKNWTTTDLLAFNLLTVLSIDLQTNVVLKEKLRHDSVRPVSAVRYLYGTTNVTAYGGPNAGGAKSFPGRDWVSYVHTFNEGEFPSGAVCWCTTMNEWIELWQDGSTTLNPPIFIGATKGCSMREPGLSPAQDTFIPVVNTRQFVNLCKDARVLGGVHFRPAVEAGQALCTGLAASVWPKVQALYPKLAGSACAA